MLKTTNQDLTEIIFHQDTMLILSRDSVLVLNYQKCKKRLKLFRRETAKVHSAKRLFVENKGNSDGPRKSNIHGNNKIFPEPRQENKMKQRLSVNFT